MDDGRLIRTRKDRDRNVVAYIVAILDSATAIDLIRKKVGAGGEVEDLGRVSGALLIALKLQPGQFTRADGAGNTAS